MPPFIKGAAASVIRLLIVGVLGYLAVELPEEQVASISGIVLTIIWALYTKVRDHQKLLVAQASGEPVTSENLVERVQAGDAPSLLTPKNKIPRPPE